jgi:hypothetical protein
LVDAAAVEDFDSVLVLETGKGPGITAPEEDVDGGGNIQAAADVERDLAVPEEFFASRALKRSDPFIYSSVI